MNKPQERAYFYCETFPLEVTFVKGHLQMSMTRGGEARQEARQGHTSEVRVGSIPMAYGSA